MWEDIAYLLCERECFTEPNVLQSRFRSQLVFYIITIQHEFEQTLTQD